MKSHFLTPESPREAVPTAPLTQTGNIAAPSGEDWYVPGDYTPYEGWGAEPEAAISLASLRERVMSPEKGDHVADYRGFPGIQWGIIADELRKQGEDAQASDHEYARQHFAVLKAYAQYASAVAIYNGCEWWDTPAAPTKQKTHLTLVHGQAAGTSTESPEKQAAVA